MMTCPTIYCIAYGIMILFYHSIDCVCDPRGWIWDLSSVINPHQINAMSTHTAPMSVQNAHYAWWYVGTRGRSGEHQYYLYINTWCYTVGWRNSTLSRLVEWLFCCSRLHSTNLLIFPAKKSFTQEFSLAFCVEFFKLDFIFCTAKCDVCRERLIVLDRSDVRDLWLFSPILGAVGMGEGCVSLLPLDAIVHIRAVDFSYIRRSQVKCTLSL